MTNYDIDEIIFPRHFETKYSQEIYKNKKTDCKNETYSFNELQEVKSHEYNIYKLAKHLSEQSPNTANFQFQHALFLAEYDMFYDVLAKALQNKADTVKYDGSNKAKLRYSMSSEEDFEYGQSIIAAMDFSRCLNKTFFEKRADVLHPLWTRSVSTKFDNRAGKSIFNTEFTLSVNQHYPNSVKSGSQSSTLPMHYGFSSHFRNVDVFTEWGRDNIMKYSIHEIRVDVEYLYFLANVSSRFSI
jgi:hypothetical protein